MALTATNPAPHTGRLQVRVTERSYSDSVKFRSSNILSSLQSYAHVFRSAFNQKLDSMVKANPVITFNSDLKYISISVRSAKIVYGLLQFYLKDQNGIVLQKECESKRVSIYRTCSTF